MVCSKIASAASTKVMVRKSRYNILLTLEAQLPVYWVPVFGSLYKLILSIT